MLDSTFFSLGLHIFRFGLHTFWLDSTLKIDPGWRQCSRRLVHMKNSADQNGVSSVAARSGNCWRTEAGHEN